MKKPKVRRKAKGQLQPKKLEPKKLPLIPCPHCPKEVGGEQGLTDHLHVVHGLGVGNMKFWGNIKAGREKNGQGCNG